jgi:hypothetical protein
MENETVAEPVLDNQSIQNKNSVVIEKKHDLAWVIVQIMIKGAIVSFPAYIVLMAIFGVILTSLGIDISTIAERSMSDPEFAKQFMVMSQVYGLILIPISYIGYRWGCKSVLKKTSIDEKDFGKIGYWVGIIPILFSILNRDIMLAALIFGIFVTPKLVKKWLIKFNQTA